MDENVGGVWGHAGRPRRQENDGSSYFLFTLGTLLTGTLAIVIDQQAGTRGAHVWFAVQAALAYAVNLVGIAALFWRTWVHQEVEVTPAWLSRWRVLHVLPWRLIRLVDHYVALNIAFSLLFMTFWVWDPTPDKQQYFALPLTLHTSNHWSAWNSFLGTAFALYNGVGFGEFSLRREAVISVATMHIVLSYPINLMVGGIVIGEAVDLLERRRQKQQQTRPDTEARAPPRDIAL